MARAHRPRSGTGSNGRGRRCTSRALSVRPSTTTRRGSRPRQTAGAQRGGARGVSPAPGAGRRPPPGVHQGVQGGLAPQVPEGSGTSERHRQEAAAMPTALTDVRAHRTVGRRLRTGKRRRRRWHLGIAPARRGERTPARGWPGPKPAGFSSVAARAHAARPPCAIAHHWFFAICAEDGMVTPGDGSPQGPGGARGREGRASVAVNIAKEQTSLDVERDLTGGSVASSRGPGSQATRRGLSPRRATASLQGA